MEFNYDIENFIENPSPHKYRIISENGEVAELIQALIIRDKPLLLYEVIDKGNWKLAALVAAELGNVEVMNYVVTNSEMKFNWDELADAAGRGGHLSTIEYTLASGKLDPTNSIALAAYNNHMDTVMTLLNKYNLDIDSLVHIAQYAAEGGAREILISLTQSLNMTTDIWNWIAIGAARGGHSDLLNEIIKNGANNWNDIACAAAEKGYLSIIIDMTRRGPTDITSIAESAAYYGQTEIVQRLLSMVRLTENDYILIATSAAEGGQRDLVINLISLLKMDKRKYCIIAKGAAKGGDRNILEGLIGLGADNYNELACAAAEGGHNLMVNDLINRGARDINWIAIKAAQGNNMETMMAMINKGADINFIAKYLAYYGEFDTLTELLSMGANGYDSIVDFATRGGHRDTVISIIDNQWDELSSKMSNVRI